MTWGTLICADDAVELAMALAVGPRRTSAGERYGPRWLTAWREAKRP
jgi:hypothetical protein